MSKAEMERFAADIKANPDLMAEVKDKAAGLASLVEFINSKGYSVTIDEAKDYIHSKAGRQLSDKELESVSGAGTTYTQTDVATTTVEATVEATTQTTSTETTAEAEAEVVVVLT
ncbi:MAG: Nif11-like leader peptide family natural product precursor [Defluviicoccus sp.]|nr:MAG: Nif11-like leader peptide family natural product precursor [Defluviicoccus sp.]